MHENATHRVVTASDDMRRPRRVLCGAIVVTCALLGIDRAKHGKWSQTVVFNEHELHGTQLNALECSARCNPLRRPSEGVMSLQARVAAHSFEPLRSVMSHNARRSGSSAKALPDWDGFSLDSAASPALHVGASAPLCDLRRKLTEPLASHRP